MQIDEFGYVISGRELMMVDRQNDDQLKVHLRYARSEKLQKLNEIHSVTFEVLAVTFLCAISSGHGIPPAGILKFPQVSTSLGLPQRAGETPEYEHD